MQAIKDATVLLALILLAATIRVTPLEDVADLVPEAQAAAERSAEAAQLSPVVRPSSDTGDSGLAKLLLSRPQTPPPVGTRPPRCEPAEDWTSRALVWIDEERDRPVQAVIEHCCTEPDRSREAPATGPAC